MIPAEALELLEVGFLAVAEVAALAFIVIVGIAAFQYMRRAVGGESGAVWVDSKGNEYLSEKDADEADARSAGSGRNALGQTYAEWEAEENSGDSDAQWAELNARTDLKEFEKDQLYADMISKNRV